MPYRCWSADSAREDRPPTMHVVTRGVDRGRIFVYPEDYRYVTDRLGECAQRTGVEVHAFCLMENHVHVLLTGPLPEQSRFMQSLKGGLARRFNYLYLRHGPLFDGPYVQAPVFSPRALLYVSCYVHMNPVVAGACSRPEDYPWSSYTWVAGPATGPSWFRPEPILEALGEAGGPGSTYAAHIAGWPHNYGVDVSEGTTLDPRGWVRSYRIGLIRSSYARLREILLGAIGEHPRASSLAKEYLVATLLRDGLAEPIEIACAFHHRTRFSIYNVFKRYRKSRTELVRFRWLVDLLDHAWGEVRATLWSGACQAQAAAPSTAISPPQP